MLHTSLFQHLRIPCVAFALMAPAVSQAQSGYTLVDLGTLGGTNCNPRNINASGQIAGECQKAGDTVNRAFRYSGGTLTDLGTLGGTNSRGWNINDSGQVAADFQLPGDATYHAVRLTGTTFTDLGTLGGGYSNAHAINNNGQVVGDSQRTGNPPGLHAYRYSGMTMQDLGTLGGTGSYGWGINTSGQATGWANTTADAAYHAFRYSGTTMQDLGTLGGRDSYGWRINDNGQVVGSSLLTGNTISHAFRCTNTTMQDLGTLGGASSNAHGINSYGDVVGGADTASSGGHAYLYTNGRMIDLNTLLPLNSGYIVTGASGINDNGWIVCYATRNGAPRAVLLKPNGAVATGYITLEGVDGVNDTNSAAPLGTFHIGFRIPGTTNEVYSSNVTLATTARVIGGTFTTSAVPPGTYDVTIQGGKNLRALVPNVTMRLVAYLPDVKLRAGDANSDNSIDVGDFGVLVNAYNGDATKPDSDYNPQADFNYDGVVDVADFGLLVNEYGNAGAP